MTIEEEIGKIRSTHLGPEDHGIPTFMLDFDFGGSGQGFGGYDLRHWGYGPVGAILSAAGVARWEDLPGRVVTVLRGEARGAIIGLKPLPFEKGKGFLMVNGEIEGLE